MVKVDYSWKKGEYSDKMFFEIYCDKCGNTYNADDIRAECPICRGEIKS